MLPGGGASATPSAADSASSFELVLSGGTSGVSMAAAAIAAAAPVPSTLHESLAFAGFGIAVSRRITLFWSLRGIACNSSAGDGCTG